MTEIVILEDMDTIASRAGWFPDRHVAIISSIKKLESEGYAVFSCVKDFLHQFNELCFTYTWKVERPIATVTGQHSIRFVMNDLIIDDLSIEQRTDIEDRLHKPICLVGEWRGEYMSLIMDNQGELYGYYAPDVYYCGPGSVKTIEKMIFDKHLEPLDPHRSVK